MGGRGGGVRNFWRVHEMDRFKWSIFGNVCDEMEKSLEKSLALFYEKRRK